MWQAGVAGNLVREALRCTTNIFLYVTISTVLGNFVLKHILTITTVDHLKSEYFLLSNFSLKDPEQNSLMAELEILKIAE